MSTIEAKLLCACESERARWKRENCASSEKFHCALFSSMIETKNQENYT